MVRGSFPFVIIPSHQLRGLLGNDLPRVAELAVRAILEHRRSLEVAHQQIKFRKHHIAFSSRVSKWGDLVLELDVGNPQLGNVIVLESDLRRAESAVRQANAGKPRHFNGPRPNGRR